jgi:exodeoxyribonuclease-1
LTEDEQDQWLQYRQQRLADETPETILNFSRFYSALAEAKQQDLPEQKQKVLAELTHFANQLAAELGYQAN